MRVATGRVVDGKIVVDGEVLEEGTVVTVLAADDEESFTLSPDQEQALRLAIAEADRGEGVEAGAFLEQLARDP
ncbi:MAG TPA: hypothetical protein VKB80_12670 [Kofleriaceae bacterium]|nr:hypothetical protein [Kofleriaceae bacterium]